MNKIQCIELVRVKLTNLTTWLEKYGLASWEYGPEGKWTTGQNIVHLVQSTIPLKNGFKIPKLALKMKFGTTNRPLRNYNAIVKRYNEKLQAADANILSPFSSDMPNPKMDEMRYWIDQLKTETKNFLEVVEKWSDKDLEKYILPHPLLGKMPMIEFIQWCGYHLEHHHKLIVKRWKEHSSNFV